MTLKRKRSVSELSSSPVRPSSSCFTSPASSINFSFNSFAGPSSPTPMPARNPSHLNSRTLKRFRDSRPSEEEVHQRTLGLLYSAQRQQQRSTHPFATASTSSVLPDVPTSQGNNNTTDANDNIRAQRSLHSFWRLPSAPTSAATAPSVGMDLVISTTCDDCGVDLPVSDDGSGAMDVDGCGLTVGDYTCAPCGKKVCSHCSVTNLEEQRRCLQCARRNAWAGGVGWANGSGVSVF